MKTKLLFLSLIVSCTLFAQDPVVHNDPFDYLAKSSGSDCTCAGWINKDLGDQGGSSQDFDGTDNDAIKFDKNNDDLAYQEVAVLANTDYKLTYRYQIEGEATSTSKLEIRILKGSEYVESYVPAYADALTADTRDFGYRELSVVETASNNIAVEVVNPTADSEYYIADFTFNTGDETSIAIFARGIGGADPGVGGSPKGYDFINGDESSRLDYVILTNETTASTEDVFASNFKIYPNPAQDYIKINSNNIEISSVEMYSIVGKRIISNQNLVDDRLDISSLTSGIYLLKVNSQERSLVKKIIVE